MRFSFLFLFQVNSQRDSFTSSPEIIRKFSISRQQFKDHKMKKATTRQRRPHKRNKTKLSGLAIRSDTEGEGSNPFGTPKYR